VTGLMLLLHWAFNPICIYVFSLSFSLSLSLSLYIYIYKEYNWSKIFGEKFHNNEEREH
jgi:hypothetical protein